jgi:hypothetical protein
MDKFMELTGGLRGKFPAQIGSYNVFLSKIKIKAEIIELGE